ncbi:MULTISPECIES: hypothetical protein [Haloferax]|uniref:hypothetical protein n=1 Tax=Haloferax TaxID=2251 RepID=UPI000B2A13BB|nr:MULTISPECIES: hypothetical protein [Haloferax]MDS0241396.1 hypothetical protein [Haloferax sp. S2CR25]MDS0241737.1 hypothetical protein [Haloferax sp. S2CR25]MDS0444517.1 hypothetical protein [Haloferax sp. S2CR25-2]MDS0444858.1 hypothetical protein [Haloferax sp. S2CR25-2]
MARHIAVRDIYESGFDEDVREALRRLIAEQAQVSVPERILVGIHHDAEIGSPDYKLIQSNTAIPPSCPAEYTLS